MVGLVPLIFYGSAACGMFQFGILARRWPELMQHWESIEAAMPKFRNQNEKRKLAIHLKMLAFFVLMSSLVEHVLSSISSYHDYKQCQRHEQTDPIKEYILPQLSHLFTFVPYSPWTAIFGKCINIIATFCWSYMDLFIIMISAGLSSRFRQINDELQRSKGLVNAHHFAICNINVQTLLILAYVRRFLGTSTDAIS